MKIAIREEEERSLKREMIGENVPEHEDKEEDREERITLWRERERLRVLRDKEAREKWRKDREGGTKKNTGEEDEAKDQKVREDEKEKDVDKKETAIGRRQYKIGPFFMETNEDGTYKEDIYNRDYNQPTLNDRIQSHYQNVKE